MKSFNKEELNFSLLPVTIFPAYISQRSTGNTLYLSLMHNKYV